MLVLLYICSGEIEAPLALPLTVDVAKEDLWSLENVGQFLQYVAEQHAEDSELRDHNSLGESNYNVEIGSYVVHRFLPSARSFPHFEKGVPNLVIVPRSKSVMIHSSVNYSSG